MRLKISSRKSDLARLQAYLVAEALKAKNPQAQIEFLFKESLGDKNLVDPLWKIPEKGVFTEDFYRELVDGQTDMVVHSWKDLPTELKPETEIVATLPRADQRDLLLIKRKDFAEIREQGKLRLFSSSPRRAYNLSDFLREALPFGQAEVSFESVRGNIPTRLRKLMQSSDVSGLVLAKAALDRLLSATMPEFQGLQKELRQILAELEWMVLPLSVNPNAAAQGALAIEILSSRQDLKQILSQINDPATFNSVQKEREILSQHGGGCHQKIGVAVLPKAYGPVQITRGLTDQGVKLEQFEILKSSPAQFSENEMWESSADFFFDREEIPSEIRIPAGINALYFAKAKAWPKNFSFSGIIWTAGVKTWKNLAKQGVWVNGTSDSLGESSPEFLEVLNGQPLQWMKFTHDQGVDTGDKKMLPIYTMHPKAAVDTAVWKKAKSFFWHSRSQFLRAIELDPSLLDRHHSSGPGHTHEAIRESLKKNGRSENLISVFLSSQEWKHKCQTR